MKLCRFTVPANPLPIVLPVIETLSPKLNEFTEMVAPNSSSEEDWTLYSFKYLNGGEPAFFRCPSLGLFSNFD